jgi:AcrR family transcriptional regulator
MAHDRELEDRILEAALALGDERGWAGVRMVDVAARAGIPAADLPRYYRDLNAVADAWFVRAWEAMLADPPPGFADWPARTRIEDRLLAWFDQLATHHRVSAQMIRGKLHGSHPHHWVPMVFDLSRTIHWLREAAQLPARYGSKRADMEEIGLTWLFLATLAVWMRDSTPGQARTRRVLRRRLREADRAMVLRWGRGRPPGAPPDPGSDTRPGTGATNFREPSG